MSDTIGIKGTLEQASSRMAMFEEGGFKRSGNGRLNGLTAINDFLEYKHIAFNSGTIADTDAS